MSAEHDKAIEAIQQAQQKQENHELRCRTAWEDAIDAIRRARELELRELRRVNAELLHTARAITLLRDSFDETDEDFLRACRCPECNAPWTVRECRVKLDKLAGGCMCGKWSFDARALIAKVEGE